MISATYQQPRFLSSALSKAGLLGMLPIMDFSQPSQARTVNRLRVLNLIRRSESASRADIARLLHLNKPSCSEIVRTLLDEGLIREEEKKLTRNGRRPTPLSLNKSGKLVVAVDMGFRSCSMAIADMRGNILRWERFPSPASPAPEEICYSILKTLLRITRGADLSGIAISLNGEISDDGKRVVRNDSWNWKDVPLALAFERNMKIPAILTNNTLAMAGAERWFAPETPDSFLFVNWGEHITSCMVQGTRMSVGAMGHMKVLDRGLCRCGAIGCLETCAGGWAISGKFGGKTVKQLCRERPAGFDEAMREACDLLALVLSSAVAITGTRHIIVGGGLSNSSDFFSHLRRAFFSQRGMDEVSLEASALADKGNMLSPVATALDYFVFRQSFLDALK